VLEKSSREVPGSPLATRTVRNGQKVMWHHGGSAHEARVYFLGTRSMEPGARVCGQLRFSAPVYAFTGDRFVLRDFARQATIAGGTVLDADASRAHFRKPRNRACHEASASDPADPAVLLAAKVQRDSAVPRASVLLKSRFSEQEVETAIAKLTAAGTIIADGVWLLDAGWWKDRVAECGDLIKAHHKALPQLTGMDFAEFSARAVAMLPDKRLLDPLLAGVTAAGFVRSGRHIRWGAHRASLPPALQAAGAKLRAALANNLIEPPNPGELAPGPVDKQALKFLLDTGEAVQLDEKAVLLVEGLEKLKGQITAHLKQAGRATASDLRQVTGTTRRILIPLLERLDRDGVTVRAGDFRTLKK
jgi:selenocysteine-specific elongation factor